MCAYFPSLGSLLAQLAPLQKLEQDHPQGGCNFTGSWLGKRADCGNQKKVPLFPGWCIPTQSIWFGRQNLGWISNPTHSFGWVPLCSELYVRICSPEEGRGIHHHCFCNFIRSVTRNSSSHSGLLGLSASFWFSEWEGQGIIKASGFIPASDFPLSPHQSFVFSLLGITYSSLCPAPGLCQQIRTICERMTLSRC